MMETGQQQYGRFTVPPSRYEAEHADKVSDPSYVPANTMDGLETVGGLRNYWEKEGHWGADARFVGFRPALRTLEVPVLEAAARRALVEALAIQASGGDLMMKEWPLTQDAQWTRVDITIGADGAPTLGGNADGVVSSLQKGSGAEAEEVTQRALTSEEAAENAERWGEEWKTAALKDLRLKFVVCGIPLLPPYFCASSYPIHEFFLFFPPSLLFLSFFLFCHTYIRAIIRI